MEKPTGPVNCVYMYRYCYLAHACSARERMLWWHFWICLVWSLSHYQSTVILSNTDTVGTTASVSALKKRPSFSIYIFLVGVAMCGWITVLYCQNSPLLFDMYASENGRQEAVSWINSGKIRNPVIWKVYVILCICVVLNVICQLS